ncbi:hypothetical protein VaNZ11_014126, partial [Volvox africanus]
QNGAGVGVGGGKFDPDDVSGDVINNVNAGYGGSGVHAGTASSKSAATSVPSSGSLDPVVDLPPIAKPPETTPAVSSSFGMDPHVPSVPSVPSERVVSSAAGSVSRVSPIPPPGRFPRGLLPVGVVTYTQLFGRDELGRIEAQVDATDVMARRGLLPPGCYHHSTGVRSAGDADTAEGSVALKRTKMFFGARYLWTREQMSQADARIAGGVRVDVPPPLRWMRHQVEEPLVGCGVIPRGFVDSIALNLYHDGSEGIQSHYDDAARFRRPIYSLRLFSDSRLSFGGHLFGNTNNDFFVPMPRGCVTVMEDDSYAANGIKHCVRPADMAGKSAALILRGIRPEAMRRARELLLTET